MWINVVICKTMPNCGCFSSFKGPERGVCNCGVCKCNKKYNGTACECPISQESCIAENGVGTSILQTSLILLAFWCDTYKNKPWLQSKRIHDVLFRSCVTEREFVIVDGARVIKKATTEGQHAKIVRLVQYSWARIEDRWWWSCVWWQRYPVIDTKDYHRFC